MIRTASAAAPYVPVEAAAVLQMAAANVSERDPAFQAAITAMMAAYFENVPVQRVILPGFGAHAAAATVTDPNAHPNAVSAAAAAPGAFSNAAVPAPAVLLAPHAALPNAGRNPTLAPRYAPYNSGGDRGRNGDGRGGKGGRYTYGGSTSADNVRCYNCQGMGHIAKDCTSPVGGCGGVRLGAGALGGGGSVSSADVHGGIIVGDTAVASSVLAGNTEGNKEGTTQVGASMKLAVMPEQGGNTIVLPVAAVLPDVCAVAHIPTAPLPVHNNPFGTLSSITDAELSTDGCELSEPSAVDELEERYYRLIADLSPE
jgi:hypothetical protein